MNPPTQFPIINLENYYSFTLDPLFSELTLLDLEYQNVFGGVTARLDKDIAGMYYALVKILVREILLSAYGRSFSSPLHLPLTISDVKLREVNMCHPPFPLHNLLEHNFLQDASPQDIINSRRIRWLQLGHQLTTWYAQVKKNASRVPNCSWDWSPQPLAPLLPKGSPAPYSVLE
jgi:hypothetical protein